MSVIERIASAIGARVGARSHLHLRRVQLYATELAVLSGLSQKDIATLSMAALLHDIGELAIPDHILNKPGALTVAEFERVKTRTTIAHQILAGVDFYGPVLPTILYHHEQWDGLGYPEGLKAEAIPVLARILSVADMFDAVQQDAPFRARMTAKEASELLVRMSGNAFEPRLVDLFLDNLSGLQSKLYVLGLASQDENSSTLNPSCFTAISEANREAYTLYEIARAFGSSLQVDDITSRLISKIGSILPFDTCVVYLYDEFMARADVAKVVGQNRTLFEGRSTAIGEGVTGFVLEKGRTICRIDPQLDFRAEEAAYASGYRSMLATPLFKNDRLLGAVTLYSTSTQQYSEDQMRIIEVIAQLASNALANARGWFEVNADPLAMPMQDRRHFQSCFISYSSKDDDFAVKLHSALRKQGVRCWFAPEDLRIGDRIRTRIDESIGHYDKLLLVLSKNSVSSHWVEKEVETAMQNERELDKTILFPVRLDDAVFAIKTGWPADVQRSRHIGDFTHWEERDHFSRAFVRLMRDLQAKGMVETHEG